MCVMRVEVAGRNLFQRKRRAVVVAYAPAARTLYHRSAVFAGSDKGGLHSRDISAIASPIYRDNMGICRDGSPHDGARSSPPSLRRPKIPQPDVSARVNQHVLRLEVSAKQTAPRGNRGRGGRSGWSGGVGGEATLTEGRDKGRVRLFHGCEHTHTKRETESERRRKRTWHSGPKLDTICGPQTLLFPCHFLPILKKLPPPCQHTATCPCA